MKKKTGIQPEDKNIKVLIEPANGRKAAIDLEPEVESMTLYVHCANGEKIAVDISCEDTSEGTLVSIDGIERYN